MKAQRSVIVRELPVELTAMNAESFFLEMRPLLASRGVQLVFDFSAVAKLDSAGLDVLLRCLSQAMQLNGDIKLAGLEAGATAALNRAQADRLFEIFPSTAEAVESYYPRITPEIGEQSTHQASKLFANSAV